MVCGIRENGGVEEEKGIENEERGCFRRAQGRRII